MSYLEHSFWQIRGWGREGYTKNAENLQIGHDITGKQPHQTGD